MYFTFLADNKMALKKDDYPIVGFRYEVNILPDSQSKKITAGNVGSVVSSMASANDDTGFLEISGVSVSLQTSELSGSGGERFSLPEEIKFSPLTLKRGLTGVQSKLMTWVAATILTENIGEGSKVTKNIVVKLLSDQGEPLVYWVFVGALPTKWSVSGLSATENKLVIEELELNYTFFYPVFLG